PAGGVPRVLAHPAADLRIRFVRRLGVGIVIEGKIPAVGRGLPDAVATVPDVVPESRNVGRIREDGSHADDGDRTMGCGAHGDLSLMSDQMSESDSDRGAG